MSKIKEVISLVYLKVCFLFQQQLNTSFDDETAAFLNDCYTLEEKERLKVEWRLFEEQKRNFEKERTNFTEAAIRLGREVFSSDRVLPQITSTMCSECCRDLFVHYVLQKRAFEEDRAAWLKNHFLNMTPFADRRRWSSSDCQSALSISKSVHYIKWSLCVLISNYLMSFMTESESELSMSSVKAPKAKSSTYTTFSTPKPSRSTTTPSTAELYRTLRLIPESRYSSVSLHF